ncbi:Prohead core protein serine protease [uncultured archaeon]|nr:Prohead core protein serine protease [uncultured archaeon]
MNKTLLLEYQKPSLWSTELTESVDSITGQKHKDLFMKGIFIQGDIRNQNQRIYPMMEIKNAVDGINHLIEGGASVTGELDHPNGLNINLERVSHFIVSMWMERANGFGKLKILPTPMGNIAKSLIDGGVKLGVSSRGSGNVNEATGYVSEYQIVTVDLVGQPSAPDAYPVPVYEALMNRNHGYKTLELAREINEDSSAQKYLAREITKLIENLHLN